jgi:hypothetical protein
MPYNCLILKHKFMTGIDGKAQSQRLSVLFDVGNVAFSKLGDAL